MAKRLSDKQKEEILIRFTDGENIEELSYQFNCNKLTISRNLKKVLGEKSYKDLLKKNKLKVNLKNEEEKIENYFNKDLNVNNSYNEFNYKEKTNPSIKNEDNFNFHTFTEITPLDQDIENIPRKDLSSIPISEIDLPKVVYMIVTDKIDLQIKVLEDYPEWNFLSPDELGRKTIEIYLDLKNAKRFCKSNQKVIKVPNSEVFKIVSPILLSKGISRIICEKDLISLGQS